jgi:transposase-like protein
MASIDVHCPKCNSVQVYRKGFNATKKGETQRFICRDCGKNFQIGYQHQARKTDIAKTIEAMILDGNSIRGISRVLGVSTYTIYKVLKKKE